MASLAPRFLCQWPTWHTYVSYRTIVPFDPPIQNRINAWNKCKLNTWFDVNMRVYTAPGFACTYLIVQIALAGMLELSPIYLNMHS